MRPSCEETTLTRKIQTTALLLFLALMMASIAHGQTAPDEKALEARVDKLFERWDKPNSPGCALAVVKDGAVIYKRGYGMANLEYDVPITPGSIFHVASISKQFTAMAVTMLAQEGKLSLDDDVRKYLPEVPDFGKVITLRHLIHHTSGLRDQWNLLVLAGWRMEDVITEQDILELVKRQKELNFEPGKEHLYCNTGYTLLALVVQRVTGQSLREFTQARIFEPLGMKNTHFHDDHRMIVKNRAYSYEPKRGGYENSPLQFANVGATSLFTTVEDLALWDQNFYDGRVGGSAVLAEMLTKGKLNDGKELDYASGLVIGEYKGLRTVAHGGADAGYRAQLLRFPDQHFSVILLANLATFDPGGLAQRVADLYLADLLKAPAPGPSPSSDVKVDPQVYDAYAGDYQLRSGAVLSFVKDQDRFLVQPDEQRKYRIYPDSETDFTLRTADVRFTFVKDGNGRATRVIVHQSGNDTPARRVERVARRPASLDDYPGEYYSEELGAIFTVALRDGKLMLRHRKGEVTLQPAIAETFRSNMGIVTFTRDRRQRIDGLLVDTGRVRRLRFVKEKPRA
jgi:CubicO group peptidase (beta-lactamase class C family)